MYCIVLYCIVLLYWSLGLPRVSIASIDEDILTTLAIYMTLRGQVDLLISILRSDHRTMDRNKTTTTTAITHSSSMNKETASGHPSTHPWDKLWLQVAQHMCARNGETEKRFTHHDRDLLSLLMRLSVEEDHYEDPSQIDPSQIERASSQNERASTQIDPLSSQILPRNTTTLISRSGLLAMVHLTIQTMIKRGETQRAEQLAKAWKI